MMRHKRGLVDPPSLSRLLSIDDQSKKRLKLLTAEEYSSKAAESNKQSNSLQQVRPRHLSLQRVHTDQLSRPLTFRSVNRSKSVSIIVRRRKNILSPVDQV